MLNQNLLLTGDDAYNLTKSLRFRSSASAYLNRTPASAGNRKTWTWSAWVKRGNITANSLLFAARTGAGGTYLTILFASTGDLRMESNSETAYPLYKTNAVFRDPSAWYHIVVALDMTQATSTNRLKVWVNGVLQTTANYNVPAQNTDLAINSTETHLIGQQASGSYFDGYLTEVNFIDGQALTPSSFGETSTTTGVWIPKKYTGTYGTNGFYLDFKDNSALTTSSNAGLGKDNSGNGNYWTTNNISITSGATYDSMTDVPTLTNATAANYAVLNPLANSGTLSAGNLTTTGGDKWSIGSIGMSSGKWYSEVTITTVGSESSVGIANRPFISGDQPVVGNLNTSSWGYAQNGNKFANTGSAYGATFTTGDIIGIAFDADAGTLTFYKNNVSQGTAFTGLASGTYYFAVEGRTSGTPNNCSINFGQRPFAYTPPTGFKALNTFNLPTPTIGATASSQAANYFASTLYTGTGSNITIANTVNGISFQPDFVWTKGRSAATNHILIDAVRGGANYLVSDSTSAESNAPSAAIQSFNSTGYVMGTGGAVNTNGATYVAWQWRASNATGVTNTAGSITSTVSANTTAGFSIVTYTGTGANATVGHGLGVAPKMIIIKNRGDISNWPVWNSNLSGNSYYLYFNKTDAQSNVNAMWNNTAPTSTVFSLGTSTDSNDTKAMVAYCFSEVAGYSRFGSYTGNGSADGPFVFCGFRPRWVMIKASSISGENWYIVDATRDSYNPSILYLSPNNSGAEGSPGAAQFFDFLSNGFKLRVSGSYSNSSGTTYIYAAFAESPFKYALGR